MRDERETAIATRAAENGMQQKKEPKQQAKDLRVGCG